MIMEREEQTIQKMETWNRNGNGILPITEMRRQEEMDEKTERESRTRRTNRIIPSSPGARGGDTLGWKGAHAPPPNQKSSG